MAERKIHFGKEWLTKWIASPPVPHKRLTSWEWKARSFQSLLFLSLDYNHTEKPEIIVFSNVSAQQQNLMVALHFKGKWSTQTLQSPSTQAGRSPLREQSPVPRAGLHCRAVWAARKGQCCMELRKPCYIKWVTPVHTQAINILPFKTLLMLSPFSSHRRRQCPIYFQFTDTLTSLKQHLAGACCKSITELWQYNKAIITRVPLRFKA